MTRVDESSGDTAKVSNQTSSEIVPNNFLIVCLRARVAELKTEVEKYKAFLNKFQISLDAASHHSELTLSMIPSATVSLSPVEASSTNIHETYCHTATQTHPAASSSSFTSTPADIAASETQKSGPVTVQSQTKEKQILREESMKEQLSHNRFLILATEENDDGDAESTTTAMPNPCETVTTMHSTPEPTSTDDHKEWIHPRRRRNMRRGGPNKGRHAPKTPNLGQNFDDASTAMGNPSMDVTVEKAVTSAVPEPVAKAKAN